MTAPLLDVQDLKTHFFNEDGVTRAVDGVSFTVAPGETLGIVGESGCGKSVTALSILRLLPPRLGRTVGGSRAASRAATCWRSARRQMRDIRGNRIAMIFQEPMTSLNPVLTIGHQIAEARAHPQGRISRGRRATGRARCWSWCGSPMPARRLDDYPHQFSGGMRQRVMIAMALACEPEAADRRRADHGARRHHPGAGAQADAGAEGEDRRGRHPHHP